MPASHHKYANLTCKKSVIHSCPIAIYARAASISTCCKRLHYIPPCILPPAMPYSIRSLPMRGLRPAPTPGLPGLRGAVARLAAGPISYITQCASYALLTGSNSNPLILSERGSLIPHNIAMQNTQANDTKTAKLKAARKAANVKPGDKPESKKQSAKPSAPDKAKAIEAKQAARAIDRGIVNKQYLALCEAGRLSIPVKPLSSYRPKQAKCHPMPRNYSERQAAALVASAIGSGAVLIPGVKLPRYFKFNDVPSVIENGCASDLIASGFVNLAGDGTGETFMLDKAGVDYITGVFGSGNLTRLNVLPA